MTKAKILFLFLLAGVLTGPVLAHASTEVSPTFFYTTDSEFSVTPKVSFALNEQPWLYIHIPGQFDGMTDWRPIVNSAWFYLPDGFFTLSSLRATKGDTGATNTVRDFWLTPGNWNDIKAPGIWGILGNYIYLTPPYGSVNKQFGSSSTFFSVTTVTPEPVSSSLFLFGVGALAVKKLRSKKKS